MKQDKVRIIPLGGIGNVTKNMYLYEYQDEILIVDCGIGFPDPTMLGVDILIPDIDYLKGKTDQIVGMVLTHGHEDHIGGLPYLLPSLGDHFPIYGSPLTIGFAKDRVKEFGLKPNFHIMPDNPFQVGPFSVFGMYVTHSIPDTRHLSIRTPVGTIYHGTDFKLDLTPVDGKQPDFNAINQVGSQGVRLMLLDGLNSEVQSFSTSESTLKATFERELKNVKGKFIVTIMSSNLHRIQQIIDVAAENGRKVAFVGRSIERNVDTGKKLGFLNIPKGVVMDKRKLPKHPPHQTVVVIAGSQGQEGSSLARAAEGEHYLVNIKSQDKVVFASEPIPGNEINVYAAIDSLSRTGAEVVYPDIAESMHASGHASAPEHQLIASFLKPQDIIPIGATYRHDIQFRKNMEDIGYHKDQVHIMENGQIIALDKDKIWVDGEIELKNVMIDGLGIGDVGSIVLRDRQVMSEDGIVIVVVPVSAQTGQVVGEVEIVSRGFVYMKESQGLVDDMIQTTKEALTKQEQVVHDWQRVRRKIEKALEKLLYEETQRRPLILPVTLEV